MQLMVDMLNLLFNAFISPNVGLSDFGKFLLRIW